MTVPSVLPTSTLMAPTEFGANLSPDGLMVYLQTRLNGLDGQINELFNTENQQAKLQSALRKLQSALGTLDDQNGGAMNDEQQTAINNALDEVAGIDAILGAKMKQDFAHVRGGLIFDHDGADIDQNYSANEVKATTEYVTGLTKDVENRAQMNMIHLQSLMSSRQTAIQLATNMISALGESTKAIVSNIGR